MGRKAIILGLLASTAAVFPAHADMAFNRIATFPVAENLPAETDAATETSSEIIARSADGNTLIYSDSPLGGVGFVDISDANAPKAGGVLKLEGEPTSVGVAGQKAIAAVNTSESYTSPSGNLVVIDMATKTAEESCELGGQPDSVAVSNDGRFLAVAIENERDEDLNDGVIPQMPAGDLKIFNLTDGAPDCGSMKTVSLSGLAEIAPEDPEPEFVDFNENGDIVVTLQENNHIAVVSAESGEVTSHFSAGQINLENIDTLDNGAIDFNQTANALKREPDAVKWLDDDRFVTANEGDYEGGSRSFTIFSKSGEVLFDSGKDLEFRAAAVGHYPDKRSDAKGTEPEGLEVASFGDQRYIFVALERASLVVVYRDTGAEPEFVQVLPSGIGPEGLVAIPERNLLVTANETDLVEDGAARSHVMVYELTEGTPVYPTIESARDDNGAPLAWGALSGLVADREKPGTLYAVSDSFYGNQPSIFTIDANEKPARITAKAIVTRDGMAAQKLDLEGIANDGEGGFWLASEGRTDRLTPHALFRIDAAGEIQDEIALPAELLAVEKRFGMEGVTVVGEGDDQMLVVAIQREWGDDPKGQVKLVSYKPVSGEWAAVRYPLDASEKGWVGLSEITAHDGKLYIVERDNQIGTSAKIKKLYSVSLESFQTASLDADLPLVEKTLVRDLVPDMKAATNGYVVDKIEGFAIDVEGTAYFVTDNDGVDDSSGETIFVNLGKLDATN
ncbi:esterase-like activity of phytase family protein [Nitratireductor kimnyeongensis]|uniref:Esterase-like activity of phytase family protein n=1 Tax=Nitratireductor kimnyeongensis TaxID=430679 RepID=A0ABW0TDE9_9HYPH|nr:esterase-like activity of phytase family protein [Nitratireductor kimnyeongensis]QZZ36865.1 esterase-like activity of phytase family protein [Nitratireductor kimnyeongensis]